MLVVQALLIVLVASRAGPTLPGVPPARLARTVAADLSQALERDATLNIQTYLREQHGGDAHPILVLMADGREFTNGAGAGRLPDAQRMSIRERLRTSATDRDVPFNVPEATPVPREPRPADGATPRRPTLRRGFDPGMPGGPGRNRFRSPRPGQIVVRGQLVGLVIVPPQAPFGFLLARYAPTMGAVSIGALLIGAALTTILVFGPARRRLRDLEVAARRLGSGDLTARASASGGDEVAAVAHAFNAMADDLAARAQALATSDRLRRQLLADVSHELTTPVTAMRGYLETLTMPDFPLDEGTRERYLRIVTDETARVERIIGDLLDLARLEGGGGALNLGAVPASDLFSRVCARHERTAAAANVTFVVEVAPGADTVYGDRDRLEQALQNLAANALRYAPAGSTIELAATPTPEGTALVVIDHGSGIPPEHLPHLFDRFYKAEASRVIDSRDATGTSHGSGLGLSIVRAIVERHGGRVGVESRPGRTAFRLEIPRTAAPPS